MIFGWTVRIFEIKIIEIFIIDTTEIFIIDTTISLSNRVIVITVDIPAVAARRKVAETGTKHPRTLWFVTGRIYFFIFFCKSDLIFFHEKIKRWRRCLFLAASAAVYLS